MIGLSAISTPYHCTALLRSVRFATPNAKGSSRPCPGLSDLRRAQQATAQPPYIRGRTPNAKGSTRTCFELSDLHRVQLEPAQLLYVHCAMQNDSTRPCPRRLRPPRA